MQLKFPLTGIQVLEFGFIMYSMYIVISFLYLGKKFSANFTNRGSVKQCPCDVTCVCKKLQSESLR